MFAAGGNSVLASGPHTSRRGAESRSASPQPVRHSHLCRSTEIDEARSTFSDHLLQAGAGWTG